LRAIIEKYNAGPVGLNTIAASVSEEADTIMDVVEPYLLQLGFLERTSQGHGNQICLRSFRSTLSQRKRKPKIVLGYFDANK